MSKKKENEMSFLEHLEELRWHIIRSILAVFICAVLAFLFKDIIFDKIILAPKSPAFFTNRFLCEIGERFELKNLCINSVPLEIISFPFIFFEFWSFIAPALHGQERKHARGAVFYSSLLFLMGVCFGYFLISPLTVHFLGSYSVSPEVENKINLISYVSTMTSVVLASGVIFELPVLVFFLTKIGLVTPAFLRKYRRHSLVAILLLSAIIPLVVLYEISIFISRSIIRKQKKREKEGL